MRLSPETCRVKPPRIKNAIVASCWTYFITIFLPHCLAWPEVQFEFTPPPVWWMLFCNFLISCYFSCSFYGISTPSLAFYSTSMTSCCSVSGNCLLSSLLSQLEFYKVPRPSHEDLGSNLGQLLHRHKLFQVDINIGTSNTKLVVCNGE